MPTPAVVGAFESRRMPSNIKSTTHQTCIIRIYHADAKGFVRDIKDALLDFGVNLLRRVDKCLLHIVRCLGRRFLPPNTQTSHKRRHNSRRGAANFNKHANDCGNMDGCEWEQEPQASAIDTRMDAHILHAWMRSCNINASSHMDTLKDTLQCVGLTRLPFVVPSQQTPRGVLII